MVNVVGYDEQAKSRITCSGTKYNPGCGAINEYDKRDIKSYSGTDYSGGSDGREWIVCGNCGKDLTLRSW